ncbi:MAG: matrixin family metalloprotease [Acidobacteria bacterium]|nr:matrixin family metalloprotease [Acidobacteriota bacterium]
MTVVFARRLGPAVALTAAILCLASASTPVGAIGRLAGDALLARASAAAVRGVVVAVSAERDPSVDTIYTHVHLAVTRAWGFPTPPAVVELKLLGGATATQVLVVGGQARFAVGEEVLVFLDVRPRDGSLSVTGLERGKWTVQTMLGGPATVTRQRHDDDAPGPARDTIAGAELDALAALAGTTVRLPALALDAPPRHDRILAPMAASDAPVGGRWHEADWGAPIFVDSMAGGHPLFPSGGFGQLLRAINLWDGASALRLLPGVLRGPRCFGNSETADGRVSISYDDPCGEIANTSPTLALGGAYYSSADVRVVGGTPYWKITKGVVVLDDARAKFSSLSTGCYEEVLTHEIGHAVGLAHATSTPAVMAPWLALECVNRTESLPLQPPDVAAVAARYPSVVPADGPPGTPAGLTGLVTGSSVQVSWLPTGAAAASYQLIVGSLPGAADVGAFPAGTTSLVATGVARGVYYIRAVAMNAHGTSAPSPDIVVVVGDGLPGIPVGLLAAAGQNGDVRVLWQPPRMGAPPHGYVLLVGTAADSPATRIPVAQTALFAQGVKSGTYFVRAVAVNGAGAGPASPEILVVVP